jgi:membrane dipeptidase
VHQRPAQALRVDRSGTPRGLNPDSRDRFSELHYDPCMNTRSLLGLSLLPLASCSSLMGAPDVSQMTEAELVRHAQGIHERVITLDTHCDIRVSNFTQDVNYAMELDSQITLPKMERGGLDVAWFIVYTGQGDLTAEGYRAAHENAMAKFDAIHRLVNELAPDQIELALTSDDVRRIDAAGKKVAMIGIENAYPVGLELANIERFQKLGGRYMSLSHNGHSQFCDSNTGERDDVWLHGGLSNLGRQAVAEMNRVGMMIDLSHPAKTSNMQTIALSRAPVIASHSSARSLNDVSRNLDDEELLAIQANGGVVQAVAFRSYVDEAKHKRNREAISLVRSSVAKEMGIEVLGRRAVRDLDETQRVAYRQSILPLEAAISARLVVVEEQAPPVDVADFVDHIDYLVQLIGLEHVGISSDFDGGGGVQGWNDASETFSVTLELVRRGYDEEKIALLWSGNLLRVLDEVQRIATEIQG